MKEMRFTLSRWISSNNSLSQLNLWGFYKSLNIYRSDGVRRLKNLFKKDASKVIVKLLLPYQRDDAIVGRIDSTEDFKHLAKKVRQIS
jgi:hypothetical protein